MVNNSKIKTLYESDYYLWLEKTAALLKEGKLLELDIPNLVEEIEDMGKSQRQALKSNLRILLMYLLKYKYQSRPDEYRNSWKYTIREHRKRIGETCKDSPSLKPYFTEVFNECYQDARELAADETGLPLGTFPQQSPFTPEQALDANYLPKEGTAG